MIGIIISENDNNCGPPLTNILYITHYKTAPLQNLHSQKPSAHSAIIRHNSSDGFVLIRRRTEV